LYLCKNFLTIQNSVSHMKKTVLCFLAGAALTFSLSSCGEKLMTPEQMSAKVEEGFQAGKAAVENEVNTACDAAFEAAVTAKVAELEAAAAQAAQEAAPAGK
jgi:hypothetical protein